MDNISSAVSPNAGNANYDECDLGLSHLCFAFEQCSKIKPFMLKIMLTTQELTALLEYVNIFNYCINLLRVKIT